MLSTVPVETQAELDESRSGYAVAILTRCSLPLYLRREAIADRMTGPVTFIGAGSTVFAKNLLGDIFSQPSLAGGAIRSLISIPSGWRTSEVVARKVRAACGRQRRPSRRPPIRRRARLERTTCSA